MIRNSLRQLKMKGALEAMDGLERIEERDPFVLALLRAESEYREDRAASRRLSYAKFPVGKEWCDIDPSLNPGIKFSEVQALGNGSFLEKNQNLCLMGQQGTGKTHSLIALGRELCRKGNSVRFYTACELVNTLEEAKAKQTLRKAMQGLLKPNLLIIDELGFIPFSESGARLLFDVFAGRYERGSIAVSTNLSFDKWIQIFGSVELTGALLDRFTHKSLIYTFEGESVRLKQARQNNGQKKEKDQLSKPVKIG
jgi:DNA replication protein DnaC